MRTEKRLRQQALPSLISESPNLRDFPVFPERINWVCLRWVVPYSEATHHTILPATLPATPIRQEHYAGTVLLVVSVSPVKERSIFPLHTAKARTLIRFVLAHID